MTLFKNVRSMCWRRFVSVIWAVRVTAAAERWLSSRMFRQCQPANQQAEEPSRQRPAMSVCHVSLVFSKAHLKTDDAVQEVKTNNYWKKRINTEKRAICLEVMKS